MLNINILEYYDIPDKESSIEVPIAISGGGKKNIAILVQINKEEVKRSKENEDLHKIIKAIRLTDEDYYLCEAEDFSNVVLGRLKMFDRLQKIMMFGASPRQFADGLKGATFEIEVYKQAEILWIPSVETLMKEENKTMKAQLWHILQEWFKLK